MKVFKLFSRIAALAVVGAGLAFGASANITPAYAQDAFTVRNSRIRIPGFADFSGNVNGENQIVAVANRAISLVLLVIGIIAVFYLILSGFQYLTAGGDADKVKKARAGIINAVIGIVIILSAFVIVRFAVGLGRTVGDTNAINDGSSSGGF